MVKVYNVRSNIHCTLCVYLDQKKFMVGSQTYMPPCTAGVANLLW